MLAPGMQIAGYRIEQVLGRGGMGVVYEAMQLSLERRVAFKLLNQDLSGDPDFRMRFQREAKLQATLEHPNIVPVYDFGESEGHLYIAMRIVRGPNLKQLIRSGATAPDLALRLLRQVASALDAAHSVGLVHRDVKPHNVLVGPGDEAYLADFGLVRSPDTEGLTRPGTVIGTPDYLAPEQVSGTDVGPSADIYALAAVLFEALTGRPPFRRSADAATALAHLTDPVPRASDVRSDLGPGVDAALARGLAKAPADRPGTAGELVELVERGVVEQATATSVDVLMAPAPELPEVAQPTTVVVEAAASGGRPRMRTWVVAGGALAAAAAGVLVVALAGGGDSEREGATARAGTPPAGATTLGGSVVDSDSDGGHRTNCEQAANTCTFVHPRHHGVNQVAPENGIITRVTLRRAKGTVTPRVIEGRRGQRRVVASGPALEGDGSDVARSFDVEIPVAKGQRVGFELGQGAQIGYRWIGKGTTEEYYEPALGSTPGAPDAVTSENEFMANATFEPDADGDGRGDISHRP